MWLEIKGILALIGIAALILFLIFMGIEKLMENEPKKKQWYEKDSKK